MPKKAAQLRAKALARLAQTPVPPESPDDPDKLLHELRVHQIELEMQNEELRGAQLALAESRDRYIDLYDFAPIGYLTLSNEGLIQDINLAGARLLGGDRKNLIGQRFARLSPPRMSIAGTTCLSKPGGRQTASIANCRLPRLMEPSSHSTSMSNAG